MIGFAERSDPDDEVKSAAVSIARVMKGGALEWMQEPLIELASWNRPFCKADHPNKKLLTSCPIAQ